MLFISFKGMTKISVAPQGDNASIDRQACIHQSHACQRNQDTVNIHSQ